MAEDPGARATWVGLTSISKCSIRIRPFHVPRKVRSQYAVGRLGRSVAVRLSTFFLLERHAELGLTPILVRVSSPPPQVSSTYPSLAQLESEAESIAQIRSHAAAAAADDDDGATGGATTPDDPEVAVRIPGAFSEDPELRRRAEAAAKKLTPEEERRLRASEVRRAVGSRDSAEPSGGGGVTAAPAAVDTRAGAADGSGSSDVTVTEAAPSPPQNDEQRAAADDGTGAGGMPAAAMASEPEPTADPVPDGRVGDGAPPPRRPVKIAPGVLALLTKQHSARAAATAAGGGGGGVGAVKEAGLGTEGSAAAAPLATPAAAAAAAATAAVASGSADLRAPTAPPVPRELPPAPQAPAARPTKPISKSLAALLARKMGGPPSEPGSGEEVAGRKMPPPSLGFLGELKARAAEKSGGVPAPPPAPHPPALPAAARGGGGEREGRLPLARGASFLDELKAKTERLS